MKSEVAVSWLNGFFIVLISYLVFSSSLNFGLAPCDDYAYTVCHEEITRGLSFDGFIWALHHLKDGIWMPLTWLSYQLDYSLSSFFSFDSISTLLHFHSVLVHAINGGLLFLFLRILFPSAPQFACVVATLFWAIQPQRVESVTWIASRKDVWCMFFELLALIGWVRFRTSSNRIRAYIFSMITFIRASMAKPSTITFPALIILLDFFFLKLLPKRKLTSQDISLLLPYVLPCIIGFAIALLAIHAQTVGGAFTASAELPFYAKLLNICAGFGIYIFHTFYPVNLAIDCVQRWPCLQPFMLPGIITSALVLGYFYKLYRDFRKGPINLNCTMQGHLLSGFLWYAVAFIPFAANFGIDSFADRFTYLPSIGFSIMLLAFFSYTKYRRATSVVSSLFLVFFACLSIRQISFWKDDITLYKHTLEVDGEDNDRAHICLASAYWEYSHDIDKCIFHCDRAYALRPDRIYNVLPIYAMALSEKGDFVRARKILKLAADDNQHVIDKIHDAGGSINGNGVHVTLHIIRAACYLADPHLRNAVRDELDAADVKKPNYILTYYLRYRLALLENNSADAARYLRALFEKGTSEFYLRFSFLKELYKETP